MQWSHEAVVKEGEEKTVKLLFCSHMSNFFNKAARKYEYFLLLELE